MKRRPLWPWERARRNASAADLIAAYLNEIAAKRPIAFTVQDSER